MLIVLRIDHRRPRVHSLKERMTSDEQVELRGSRIPLKFSFPQEKHFLPRLSRTLEKAVGSRGEKEASRISKTVVCF